MHPKRRWEVVTEVEELSSSPDAVHMTKSSCIHHPKSRRLEQKVYIFVQRAAAKKGGRGFVC